jgi:hypothetical protein
VKIALIGDENGIAYPHFICHVCEKPIMDVRMGLAVWFREEMKPGESCDGFVVHKRECDKKLQAEHGTRFFDGLSLELYRLGQMTFDHPSRQLKYFEPYVTFPSAAAADSL